MMAVPAGVSCAVPITAEFKQNVAVASQNVTVPSVSGAPFDTEAVSVTTVPDATGEADTTRVVVVGVPGRPAATGGRVKGAAINIEMTTKIEDRSLWLIVRKDRDMCWAPAGR